jgi:hypothetical protein
MIQYLSGGFMSFCVKTILNQIGNTPFAAYSLSIWYFTPKVTEDTIGLGQKKDGNLSHKRIDKIIDYFPNSSESSRITSKMVEYSIACDI